MERKKSKKFFKNILLCSLCLSMAGLTAVNILHVKNNRLDDVVKNREELLIDINKYEIDSNLEKSIDNLSEYDCKFISALIGYGVRNSAIRQADDNGVAPFHSMNDFIVQNDDIYLLHNQNITYGINQKFMIDKVTKYKTNQKNIDLLKSLIIVENFSLDYYESYCSIKEYKENLKTVLAITGISYNDLISLIINKTDDAFDYAVEKITNVIAPYFEDTLQNGSSISTNFTESISLNKEKKDFSLDKDLNTSWKNFVEDISSKLPSTFENNIENKIK